MHAMQQQRRIKEDEIPHLAAPQLEVFDTVGKPLPTSLADGQPPKVISELLGHATVAFTMDVYTEVAEELAEAAAVAIAAFIPRRNRPAAASALCPHCEGTGSILRAD